MTKRSTAEQATIIAGVAAVAAVGGVATAPVVGSGWYRRLDKPSWQPPDAVFGPVWGVLYAMIASSMLTLRGCREDDEHQGSIMILFGSNLALNLAWTLLFFRGRSPVAAGVEIVALEGTTIALIVRAWPVSRTAALLLMPYALWVAFATALTWSIARRNR
jgi:benzodiazapine receptor